MEGLGPRDARADQREDHCRVKLRDRYTRHEVAALRAGGPSGRRQALIFAVEGAFGCEREHEAGESAEDHANADQRADDPHGAGRPRPPDHDRQNEGDDAVDQEPRRAVARAELEGLNDFDYSLKKEVHGQDEGEGDEGVEGVHEEVDAGYQVDCADDNLPQDTAGSVGFEGEDEVGDAAEDHRPGEDERDSEPGERWNKDGEEAGQDEQNTEGNGPVDGFGGKSGEWGSRGAHGVLLQKG
jgi:hypothetical protein